MPSMDYKERLKNYRLRENLTFQALADKLGVDRKTLWMWRAGRENPSELHMARIMRLGQEDLHACGTPLQPLYTDAGDRNLAQIGYICPVHQVVRLIRGQA